MPQNKLNAIVFFQDDSNESNEKSERSDSATDALTCDKKDVDDKKETTPNIIETDEPPSKKTKCEVASEVIDDKAEGQNVSEYEKEVASIDHSNDSVSSPSSPESDKMGSEVEKTRQRSDEFYKSNQVLQPTIIDVLRKSCNELLNSLQRYCDSK